MPSRLAQRLPFNVPIFAFSHCRDVVVEVTKAGGFGVLGASTFSPEQLAIELDWIDRHVEGRAYGVDVIIPVRYNAEAEAQLGKSDLHKLIPAEQQKFMDDILAAEGVPELPPEERARVHEEIVNGYGGMTPDGARRLLDVILQHDQVRLVVSALGAPPPDVVKRLNDNDIMVGALCGKPHQAQRHLQAGVEVIIAQGTEAGGHTGDIATLVLVPQVIDAIDNAVPVLAAGGIARGSQVAAMLALGAEGVWCGTVWLGTRESELSPFAKSAIFNARTEDAVRRRCRTGKTVRMLKSKLSEVWEQPGAPPYLQAPLQGILFNEITARVQRAERADLLSIPAGQVVGTLTGETSVRQVMYDMQVEMADALERMGALGQAPE